MKMAFKRVSTIVNRRTFMSSTALKMVHKGNRAPDCVSDKLLFTPGPLLTSHTVKEAMTHDLGSRDIAFISAVQEIRQGVLDVANVSSDDWTMIPIQGSGTFGVEATITSTVPREGAVLVIANGAYGMRQVAMCKHAGIQHFVLQYKDNEAPLLAEADEVLMQNPNITHVSMVHSETTSGIVNDIELFGKLCEEHKRTYIVDAMSSFGGIPIDLEGCNISYLVTSANKCIQGVPGFAVLVANKKALERDSGNARSLSLDIHQQVKGLDKDGQFRFTPPTHTILAFKQALQELKEEGGVAGRYARYMETRNVIDRGMTALGFERYLPEELQGPIISTYKYPLDPSWSFSRFYDELNNRGFVIYPGKVTDFDCFRIGHIGHLFPEHGQQLVEAVGEVLGDMGVNMKYKQ